MNIASKFVDINLKTYMKLRKITFVTLSLSAFYVILSSNSSGPGGNRTGSPGSSGNCSGCHSNAQVSGAVDILVKDQNGNTVTSYIPNNKYSISVNANGNSSKFGFQFTAMNSSNQKIGTYGTAPAKTTVYNSGQAQIWGHNSPATTSQNATWTIEWTAPAAGSGEITMYTASVISNSSNSDNGDFVATKNIKLSEEATNSSQNISNNHSTIYFNTFQKSILSELTISKIMIWDYSGKMINTCNNPGRQYSLDFLKPGTYIANVTTMNGFQQTLKIAIN
jgi:hypothetical protein